ncbi:adenylate/guanylate cyclase domain-containing protein [Bradyrhizobium sp.]|uniref:adenylate/guanylate cyclase domain-containing protein n=1 Tax=Bradyrhizobium sp. TaxID=376 RepID=UPI001D23E8B5|nr:adenylate/guanylate cyclase domain-containing protein [Bradyrhizobium sp.]MBI5322924.1 AAA family ATPase [Bradyrhizobium sp.]
MQCPRCRQDNRDEARFCRECGMAFGLACTTCGSYVRAESKYCDSCGAAAPAVGTGLSTPALSASPFFHAPSHLARSIFTSETSLEGERKQVTVLCSDMKGSTEYIADLDPEDARSLLDPVLERMMEAVGRYEGTINQVMGDGIQALFGAPVAFEDHAVRACYAALKMQELIRKYAEEVRRTRGLPLLVRVGLNSGEVVVRSLGSELHMNYSAHGQAVHLAARLEQMAVPGTILMSSQTLHLAQGYVMSRSLGPMFVKGLAAPVLSYELLGAVAVSRLQALARHGLTRFVGRDGEIRQLRQALDLAYARHGQIVALVGEPGVGKSRLIHEFTRAPHADDWRILEAGAVSYGSATSYLPVTEFLKGYFELATTDDSQAIREKVTTKLLSLDEGLLAALPALLLLLDPSADDAQALPADRPQRGQRILEGVKRLLFRESEVQPLLLVFEDLHSIDPETQALIDGLVDGLPGARILVLVSYRPEYRHGWTGKSYFTQIRIDPFQPDIASELLDALLGADEGLGQLKDILIEKTGGTPLFLEESVRSLVETGVLSGRPAGYHATTSIVELKMPTTIEALLTSRIDRLSLVDKRLLQAAAVIGYAVPRSVLQAVANLRPERLREALKRLQDAEFLYETSLFPDIEYRFKHALVHDAAYRMLSADRRRTLHTAALIAGEQIYADRLSEKSDWLAFHAVRAQAWDRAVVHLQVAAAREISRAANRVAVQHLEAALIAVDHLPPDERATLAIDLRTDLRHALTPLGRVQETLDHLKVAEQAAATLGDSARLARIYSFTANCLVLKARYAEALSTGERALSLAGDDGRLQLATRMYMARARQARGEFRQAIASFEEILAMVEQKPSDDFHGLPVLPAAFIRSSLAICLAVVGEFAEAEAYASEAARRADAVGQPDSIMWAYWSIGSVALNKGDSGAAVLVFDRLLDVCTTHDLDAYASRMMAGLGRTMARLGQVREGLGLLEKAVALDELAEPQITRSLTLIAYVEALVLADEFDKALTAVTDLLQRTRSLGERGAEAHACWLAAAIHAARGVELAAGEAMIETAATIAGELELLPLLAHCHLTRADLYRRGTLQVEAGIWQDRGEKLLDQLGMKVWFTTPS